MFDEIVFLRHGRTSLNLASRLQGQIDIPLDIVGQWQVDQSAYTLAQRYYWAKVSNIARHPDLLAQSPDMQVPRSEIAEYEQAPASQRSMHVVSSDLFRAQQTAHAFADILGLEVHVNPRLRERSFGQWEGMTREEIHDEYPQAFDSWSNKTGGEVEYGVEPRHDVGLRGAQAIQDIVDQSRQEPRHDTLMVVSHGSWIAATIATLLHMDIEESSNLAGVRNAFWSTVRVQYDGTNTHWVLERFNEGPQIAAVVDWENGPSELRNPHMGVWHPVKGVKA